MSVSNVILFIIICYVARRVIRFLKARKTGCATSNPQTVRLISKGRIIEVAPLVVFEQPNIKNQVEPAVRVKSLGDEMTEQALKDHMNMIDAIGNSANPLHHVYGMDKD
jgi:hypothetical protein